MAIQFPQNVRNLFVKEDQNAQLPQEFVQDAQAHFQANLPYVFIYGIDTKKKGHFLNAEQYNHTLETIKKHICCCKSAIVKVHHLIIRNKNEEPMLLSTNKHVFGSLLAQACSLTAKQKKITAARDKVIPMLVEETGYENVVHQLQQKTVRSAETLKQMEQKNPNQAKDIKAKLSVDKRD